MSNAATHRHLLAHGPARLRALLAGLPDALLDTNDGEATWSPRQVAGHLLDAERTTWIQRLAIIVAGDPEAVLPPFDRDAHLERYAGVPLESLLGEFEDARAANLAALDQMPLDDETLARRARHTVLGDVTAAQLLATWATHDWAHLTQIARTIARSQRAAVGPWVSFLSVFSR